jgi:hypothetical protein
MQNMKMRIGRRMTMVILASAIGWIGLNIDNRVYAQTPAAASANVSPDVQEIVTLSRQHMDDSVITNYIISTGKSYKLSADDIIYLNGQGVSQGVISALLKTDTASAAPPAAATPTPAATASSSAAPPALDDSAAPPPASTSGEPSSPPPGPAPQPMPTPTTMAVPMVLQDSFYADGGLNPNLWQTQSGLLSALASMSGGQVLPALAFSPSGMQMSGIGGPGQFMGIQSTASFVPPFNFSATVSGMTQRAIPFEIYLVSSDLRQWVSVAGHLGGRAEDRERVHVGIGPFGWTSGRPANGPDYGFWINHTGSGLPISALGYKLADNPFAGIPYTVQISAGSDGAASVTLINASGIVLASLNVPVGTGPFYVVLAGRDGLTFANWQSVQLTPAGPPAGFQAFAQPAATPEAAPPTVPPTPNLDYFQSQLAPYGNWINVPGYGLCWQPAVDPGWRPYYDGGHWEDTDAGWYWQSDYPWGDITFHYGRWTYMNLPGASGWVWVPGFDYAPSWAVWRHDDDDGYIGWAPLPPGALFIDGGWEYNHVRVGADFAFGLGDTYFSYVDYDHLYFDPHLYPRGYRHFIVPHDRLVLVYRHGIIENHYQFDHGHFINVGLGHDRMVVLTHHDFRPVPMAELRHQEEVHNAVVRRDDIHDFHPGASHPMAIRPMASHPGPVQNHNPGQQHPQPQGQSQGHPQSQGQNQNDHDHGNQQWH